jgi:hypothetical protein
MDYEQAKSLVISRLHARGVGGDEGVAILEHMTERKPYGWVLYYNAQRFIRSGNLLDSLAGGGPVVVIEETGDIHELGSARPGHEEVAALERRLGLQAR